MVYSCMHFQVLHQDLFLESMSGYTFTPSMEHFTSSGNADINTGQVEGTNSLQTILRKTSKVG